MTQNTSNTSAVNASKSSNLSTEANTTQGGARNRSSKKGKK